MRCIVAIFLLAFAMLASNGAVLGDQNTIASSDTKPVARSLRTDGADEERARKSGGGARGTSRRRTDGTAGATSLISSIRAKVAESKYKAWFGMGLKPKQVDRKLDLTNPTHKAYSKGYLNYWQVRSVGYVPYYPYPNNDKSKDKDE
ncbi:hypothetical protein PHYBOEH_001704 [Phytophthora boehmeriae]|uniref:RxLR effector protein n=1 Tax=Phytophthora boehmeriae TaxID=109152 RepID=A0A8T1WTJ4_9STRA|nr:hypothetical protein PHYBOEH_001704 [Phytophthora boehmeriae]